ncbi:16664_t:CDS:2, partial [Gigaspora rosea]
GNVFVSVEPNGNVFVSLGPGLSVDNNVFDFIGPGISVGGNGFLGVNVPVASRGHFLSANPKSTMANIRRIVKISSP